MAKPANHLIPDRNLALESSLHLTMPKGSSATSLCRVPSPPGLRTRTRTRSSGGAFRMIDKSMPILVVDDYATMVRIIRNLLKQIGFENVDDASNGEAALEKIRNNNYGLVFSDWNMEPMSGIELLQRVRSDPRTANTPFIMVTAESKTDNVI